MIYDAARDFQAGRMLHSADPDTRAKGAWITTPDSSAAYFALMRERLATETDDACREAYVYALGRRATGADFDAVTARIATDASGRVRAAGYLAAARIDTPRYHAWLAAQPPPRDLWDRLGRTQARLWQNDFSDTSPLFDAAESGDAIARLAAGRALARAVRPLLEIAGAWPIDAEPPDGAAWPQELVAEVKRRCANVNLVAIYRDSLGHIEAAERVQRDVRRLTSARDQIRRLLFR